VIQDSVSSLLVTRDPKLRNALNYLFSVALKHHFEASDCLKDLQARFSGKDAVFVHMTSKCTQSLELITQAKSMRTAPVVIVLQGEKADLGAQAFLAGADDVVTWPCSLHELAARLFVRLGRPLDQTNLPIDKISWETEAYIAERAGLTLSEAQVMRVLYHRDGQIVSRDELSLALDDRPWRYGDRKFDVHVAKIRKKLSDSFCSGVSVSTIRSSGYRLVTSGDDLFERG